MENAPATKTAARPDSDVCTIGLAQCAHPADGNAIALVERYAREAAEAGCDLLVFPECLMTPFESTPEEFRVTAEPLDGPFCQAVDAIAARYGLWIVSTANEQHEDPARQPYNTARITDSSGVCRGFYRKTHLFDAQGKRESDRVSAGDALFSPIETPFGRIGLSICYDLRFPEVARAAAVAGCDILINPAAWVTGPLKAEHWRALLQARAIENEMYVVGVSRVDAPDTSIADKRYIGYSSVVDPYGIIHENGSFFGEELVVDEIDLSFVREARAATPVFEHRRPELY